MKNLLASAALAVGLSTAPVSAESNNTSPESKELNPSVLTLKSSVKDQTSLALDILKGQEITAKQIREYLISLGINPKELPWVQIVENNYTPGQFQNSINTQDLGLWEETPFNVENISSKFEEVLKKINEFQTQNDSQEVGCIQGDWTQRFAELSPNEDEVDVLNALISQLPETVKPLPIANALTWVIALNKYKDQNISELSEAEKVILISNVYSVVSVLDPQKVEGTVSLVLPAGLDVKGQKLESPKTYPSINVDKQVVQMIADLWVDLPIEMVSGFQDIHQEYQTILAELKQKADSQDSEKRAQRYMRFHDQYADAFSQMPTTSKIDMLQILSTGNDEGSKLKGQKLLDKASEYISILDSWYTEENGVIVSKYNDFMTKFNSTSEQILSEILYSRLPENVLEIVYADELLAQSEKELAEAKEFALNAKNQRIQSEKELAYAKIKRIESEKLLQALLALKKESKNVAYNSN